MSVGQEKQINLTYHINIIKEKIHMIISSDAGEIFVNFLKNWQICDFLKSLRKLKRKNKSHIPTKNSKYLHWKLSLYDWK